MNIKTSDRLYGIGFIMPTILLLIMLIGFPVGYNLYISLFHKHAFLPVKKWVFLTNYLELFTDEQFLMSFKIGLVFTTVSTIYQIIVGVGVALLLHEGFYGRTFARGVVLWKWVLNDQYGIVNYFLQWVGIIDHPVVWVGPRRIMSSLITVSIWTYFPFVVINILARLQVIPNELFDAAKVDGCNVFRRFWHITLPQIQQVLFIVVLLRGIWMFTKFDIVWLWAGDYGGIGENIRTLPIYAYMKTFGHFQVGMGAALANLMCVMLMVSVTIYFKVFREQEEV